MTRALLPAALAVAVTATGPGPTPDFSADRFKAHVAFLADDLLEGREAGTRGHEIAARYVAAQFAQLGIKPGGNDDGYFEQGHFLETTPTDDSTLVITASGRSRTFTRGVDASMIGPPESGSATVNAPLVFVGYGMTDTRLGVDDYKDLDVSGKIAVVLAGSPKGMDSEIAAHLTSEQARVAAEHGAVGLIVVPSRAFAAVVPWEQMRHFADHVTTWVRTDGTPFNAAPGLKIGAIIDQKASDVLFEGAPVTLARVLDAADQPGGRPAGFALATSARLAITTHARAFTSPEVVGVIEGADVALRNEYVALMAHADHIGISSEGVGDRINNGALDNAAGVATLLEVGRAFAMAGERPRRSILLVANTAEEKGLLGAEYFAHVPTVPIAQITAAIDLDMPLLLYDFTDVVAYGAAHSTVERAFRQAGAAMGITLSPDPMPEQAIFVRSDHYAMVKAGVPGVMLATGMANGGEASWSAFLAGRYHQPSDDLSQQIHWNAGARFAELNYRAVRVLVDADQPARWYEHDYFGDLFAPNAPKASR